MTKASTAYGAWMTAARAVAKTWRTFSRVRIAIGLKSADRRLLAEAMLALLTARLRCGLLPWRIVARQLGGFRSPDAVGSVPQRTMACADDDAIRDVRWAIRMTAPAMPFRAVRLQQAVAARNGVRRGIANVLHLGVSRAADGTLAAHAWLDAGGRPVTGYPVDPALVEVGRLAAPPGRRSTHTHG